MWTVRIGDMTVHRVEELLGPSNMPAAQLLGYDPAVLAEAPELAEPNFLDPATGRLISSVHSWILRLGDKVVLIDTGAGNDKHRVPPSNPRFHMLTTNWFERLAAVGVAPDDIATVINTHLHVDHVGWNTRLEDGRWTPTFPKARYLMGRLELDHWHDPNGGVRYHPGNMPAIADSVDPIVEGGLVDTFEPGDEILPGVVVQAAPGHTAGQVVLRFESRGEVGIFSADVFHQPMQIVRTEWNTKYCEQPDVAVATRRALLGQAVDEGAVLFPSHTGAPFAGTITRRDGGFRFVPVKPD